MTTENTIPEISILDIVKDPSKMPAMIAALIAEIKDRAALSVQYKKDMDTSSTNVKRDHFKEKLKNNNEQIADMIVVLNQALQSEMESEF
jgi:hypothetical protein